MFRREDVGEGLAAMIETFTFEQARQIAERHWETGIWTKVIKKPTAWVLHIELADDPPQVAVFTTFEEAAAQLDAFKADIFDPSQNVEQARACIFHCGSYGWGDEVGIEVSRREKSGTSIPALNSPE